VILPNDISLDAPSKNAPTVEIKFSKAQIVKNLGGFHNVQCSLDHRPCAGTQNRANQVSLRSCDIRISPHS
jgi:hypothetical protein